VVPLLQVAVSSSELVTSLLVLVSSDTNEVQVLSAHCLARFSAWQGVAQQAICNFSSAEVSDTAGFLAPPYLVQQTHLKYACCTAVLVEIMLYQHQVGSWYTKGAYFALLVPGWLAFQYKGITSGLSLHLYPSCIYDIGVEQGILGRLSQVHGNHVFCLPSCPSGAEHTKYSSFMRTLPAHKPKDPGQRPYKAALQHWPSMQTVNVEHLGKTYQYAWCAGACLSADYSLGHG